MASQAQLASLLAVGSNPISDLNNQLPVAQPVTLNEFVDECSRLIDGIDPQQHTDPRKRSIPLPKSKLAVTPFQLREAWKMLNQRERTGLRGGLQASSPGIGKSFIVIAVVLLRALMFESARNVEEFWSTSEGKTPKKARAPKHLPPNASGHGLRCPSQRRGDITCFCVPDSKARSFVSSGIAPRGVSLIQAPLAIVVQWISIFQNALLDPSVYNLVIVSPDTPVSLRRNFTQITQSLSKPGARGSHNAPETYIFFSSHTNPKVFDTFTKADIFVGILLSDESHQAMRLESKSLAIAEAQARVADGLDLWLVSATPIRLIEDFELPVGLISNSHDLSRAAAVAGMVAARTTASLDMQTFMASWAQVFDDKLVLRNKVTSQFCGKSITSLRIVEPDRVWFQTPQQYFDDIQEIAYAAREVIRDKAVAATMENNGKFQPEYAVGIDARLHFVSLFPGAVNLILQSELNIEEENVKKRIAAIKDPNKLKVEKIEQFQQHLDQVSRDSPKLDHILETIGRMQADREERAPDPKLQASLHKENLSLKKMVILTPTLGTAVFLTIFLSKHMPALNPVCLHNSARPADREAALNSFKSLTARKGAKHSYVLIAPISSSGVGLDLQSANYQILVSPPRSRDSETQGFGRTNRTGQRLTLHHSTLIMHDNPADQINVVNYAGRSFRGDPFEMNRPLVLAEPDGSKKIQRLSDWGYRVREFEMMQEVMAEVFPLVDESEFHGREITHPAAAINYLDRVIYFDSDSAAGDELAVSEAWNARWDSRPWYEKLALRDILLAFWVFELNRPARDLRSITYLTVKEANLNRTLRPHVYTLLGVDLTEQLVVNRDGESPEEEEAFTALLEGAPFCVGAQRMLDEHSEFAGVQIGSFQFLPDEVDVDFGDPEDPSFNFRINFQ